MQSNNIKKFIRDKQKEANKARKQASKIGEFRGELYWQGKLSAFNEVMAYLGVTSCPEGYVFDKRFKVCVPLPLVCTTWHPLKKRRRCG